MKLSPNKAQRSLAVFVITLIGIKNTTDTGTGWKSSTHHPDRYCCENVRKEALLPLFALRIGWCARDVDDSDHRVQGVQRGGSAQDRVPCQCRVQGNHEHPRAP